MSCTKDDLEDVAKLRCAREALLNTDDHFAPYCILDDDLEASLRWASSRTSNETMKAREDIMCQLEKRSEQLRLDGACSAWLSGADAHI
jgi:hypothetical protein